jgi:hypothetical protein
MEQLLNNEIIKSIAIGVGILFILWIILSKDTNKDTKKEDEKRVVTIKDLNTIFSQNKEIVQLGKYLDFFSIEFNKKRIELEDLEGEIEEALIELDKQKNKIEFVKNSPELKELKKVKEELLKLEQIKQMFQDINRTQAKRFTIVLLVKFIQDLYEQLHDVKLTVKDIEEMIGEYLDSEDTSSGGNSKSLRNMIKGPGGM